MSAQPVNLFNYVHLAQLRSSLAQTMAIRRGHGLHRDNALWYPKGGTKGCSAAKQVGYVPTTARISGNGRIKFPGSMLECVAPYPCVRV
jgi:hypothetical protein